MKKLSLKEFQNIAVLKGEIDRMVLLDPWWLGQIPIHDEVEFIADFYLLLNYTIHNHEDIHSLVITPTEVFFSKQNTKALIQYRMAHTILDVSEIRQLKEAMKISSKQELSLCFGNWAAMHLTGVTTANCSDWIGLHHVQKIVAVKGVPGEAYRRNFQFDSGLRITLRVHKGFSERLFNITLMSCLELAALRLLSEEIGVSFKLREQSDNILRSHDDFFSVRSERVSKELVSEYLQSFQNHTLQRIAQNSEFDEFTDTFDDFERFFRGSLKRYRNFC